MSEKKLFNSLAALLVLVGFVGVANTGRDSIGTEPDKLLDAGKQPMAFDVRKKRIEGSLEKMITKKSGQVETPAVQVADGPKMSIEGPLKTTLNFRKTLQDITSIKGIVATNKPAPERKLDVGKGLIEASVERLLVLQKGTATDVDQEPANEIVANQTTHEKQNDDSNPNVEPGKVTWHESFEVACAASAKSGKPVLLFQLLGQLDQRFT